MIICLCLSIHMNVYGKIKMNFGFIGEYMAIDAL